MKANQAFTRSEDAVSPVIGVILMVAITVVLAAVVFVLVGSVNTDTEATSWPARVDVDGGVLSGVITHKGGDCADITNFEFRIDGTAVTSANIANSGTGNEWCVLDTITLTTTAGTHSLDVIDLNSNLPVLEDESFTATAT